MLKLYRLTEMAKEYWETWKDSPESYVVHWGNLGSGGSTKAVPADSDSGEDWPIQLCREIDELLANGFSPIEIEDHDTLMVEFTVDGMGTETDLEKRHRLQDRMSDTLGWTGLGMCDGGSIGSGSMEVCCFVVDFALAKQVVEKDLQGTEFSNYTRIYREE
jgi:hypothetical protein